MDSKKEQHQPPGAQKRSMSASPSRSKHFKSDNEIEADKKIYEKHPELDVKFKHSPSEPFLIGDYSRAFSLPMVETQHAGLKAISSETLRDLLLGKFDNRVASYKIIDCRYPYEFKGGHIVGAVNLHLHEHIIDLLANKSSKDYQVLIFHCEFSMQRAPKLSKFLRHQDRFLNTYPALHFPEVYLLSGGFKNFYETNAELCDPSSYRPMLDPKYLEDLKAFRVKSKCNRKEYRKEAANGSDRDSDKKRWTKSRSRLNFC